MPARAGLWLMGMVLLAAACGGGGGCGKPPPPSRPNVLLVVVDTLRKDHLPVYGYTLRPTAPALAALAAEPDAAVIDGLVACSSWTKPSMATLLTGLPPREHGVMRLAGPGAALHDADVLPAVLQRSGYATGCVMSNHLLTRQNGAGFDAGFDFWDDAPAAGLHAGSSSAQVADAGIGWLQERPAHEPWFLMLHFFDPHAVLMDHPGLDWFQPGYGGWVKGADGVDRLREMQRRCTPADRAQLAALYDEEVRAVDDAFGRVLAALRQRPDWQDTIVIFTADHGEELAERGLIGHTQTLHTELTDLPLVVRIPAGWKDRWNLPALVDGGYAEQQLYGSILGLAGILAPPGPPGSDGRGLRPDYLAMEVDFVPIRDEHAEKFVHKRALVRGSFKLIQDLNAGTLQAFDRSRDPAELSDLPADHPERAALEALLQRHPWWESP
jgi:arylsulfatase